MSTTGSQKAPPVALGARLRLVVGVLVALTAGGPGVSWAQSVYTVAPSGDDDAAGGTESPWATLQYAADRVGPGDTVVVRAGTYEGFYLETSGTANAPITFAAEPGARIDSDNDTTPDGINLEGASWVTLEGFEVVGTTRAGIRAVLCEHVTIRGNRLDQNGRWGVLTGFCDDLLIEGNEASRSADEHGIYVSNSGDRPVIRGNVIWENNANGIHMNGDASQGGDGVISDALVESNIIWGNGEAGGSGINGDGVQDSVIRNNVIYESHASGISLYQIDGGEASTGNLVVNNTVLTEADGRWALNIQDGSTGNRVYNNILWSAHSFRGAIALSADSQTGFESDYNAVLDVLSDDGGDTAMSLVEWRAALGTDAHSIVASPDELFVDVDSRDYALTADSPARDAGSGDVFAALDLLGRARPIGDGVDIGAYEYCQGQDCDPGGDAGGPDGGSDLDSGGVEPDLGGGGDVDSGDALGGGDPPSDSGGGETGDTAGGADESGCGCAAAGHAPRGGALVLWVLALVAVRRARAQRRGSRSSGVLGSR